MTRIYLTEEQSHIINQSMFVVEGSYEHGYMDNDEFHNVCMMLGIDVYDDYDSPMWLYNNITRVNKELLSINKPQYVITDIYVKSLDELYDELHGCDNGVLAYHYTVDNNEYTVHSGLYAY